MGTPLGPEDEVLAQTLAHVWFDDPTLPQANWDSFQHERDLVDQGELLKVEHFRVMKEAFDVIGPGTGDTVLEVGAASGYYKHVLEVAGVPVEYTGLDCSEAARDFAADKHSEVPYIIGDAEALTLPNGSYDTVISGYLLIHVYDWQAHIREAARVARQWVVLHRVITHRGPDVGRYSATVYGVDCLLNLFTISSLVNAARAEGLTLRALIPISGSGDFVNYSFVFEK